MSDHRRTSVAVMARRVEPADSLDFFPTPPWATRAFCEHVLPAVWPLPDRFDCWSWDPACGEGHMAVALADYFAGVGATDIHPYGFGGVEDFLQLHPRGGGRDWIITNPPFNRAADFVRHALDIATRGVAMLVRTQFLEGSRRHAALFNPTPPQIVAQFIERVPMHRGRWEPNGSTATAYCWVVWLKSPPHDWKHTRFIWIPVSRKKLTRPDDAMRFNAAAAVPLLDETPATLATIDEVRAALQARLI